MSRDEIKNAYLKIFAKIDLCNQQEADGDKFAAIGSMKIVTDSVEYVTSQSDPQTLQQVYDLAEKEYY
jgi:3-deoxy-D-manno-octulosonic-acid transferase